jgi:hypothetical protein
LVILSSLPADLYNYQQIDTRHCVAALLISFITFVLTQCPINSNKRQKKIEQGIESLAKQIDSLKQVIQSMPTRQEQPPKQDTATNK